MKTLTVKEHIPLPYTALLRSKQAGGKVMVSFNPSAQVDDDVAGVLLKTHTGVFYEPGSAEEKQALEKNPWKLKPTFKVEAVIAVVKELTDEQAAAVLAYAQALKSGKPAGAEAEQDTLQNMLLANAQKRIDELTEQLEALKTTGTAAGNEEEQDEQAPGASMNRKQLAKIAKKHGVEIAETDTAADIAVKLTAKGVQL